MVMKPSSPPGLVPAPLSQAANNPPYPVSPSDEYPPQLPSNSNQQQQQQQQQQQPQQLYSPDLNSSPAFHLKPLNDAQRQQQQQKKKEEEDDVDSDYSDLSDWDKSDDEDTGPKDIPDPLKIGGGKPLPPSANKNAIPDALRAGPPTGVPIPKPAQPVSPEPTGANAASSSWGHVSNSSTGSVALQTNNPYLRIQNTGQNNFGSESSQAIWGDAPGHAQQYGELVELPSFQTPDTPTNRMANVSLNNDVSPPQQTPRQTDQPPQPQQPHYPPPQPPQQPPQPPQQWQAESQQPWQPEIQQQQNGQHPQRHQSIDQPPLIAVESASPDSPNPRHDSNASEAWNPGMDISSLDAFARSRGLPSDNNQHQPPPQTWQEQQDWDRNERERQQRETAAAHEAAVRAEQERHHEEEYHRVEQASNLTHGSSPPLGEEQAPALPTRPQEQEEQPPAMPPRPINTAIGASQTAQDSPNTVLNNQRREHYQIKHIRWFDASTRSVRTSPILTQNINGPCPLLALVNALSLSTPAGVHTEFIETLRTREQVSLGLLLDAVFEELMSGRRGGAARDLPDVNALYTFLMGLHTGLNVNPMFVQDPTATDGPSTLIPGVSARPGGFENTKEMKLYSTFDVPLFHGWLPEPGSDAYIAFERVSKTYDSAMIVQFQLEELDAKLQTDGLSVDEQQLFTDIHAIKEFLDRWQSQLSDHGLRTIRESLQPGQIAILFRNDHFSTLYKNPHTDELMTLVTDQGYSSHDEIVWESLVDVSGRGSDLYSGDFRAVGNNSNPQRQQHQQPVQSLLDVDDNQGWTTVGNRRNNQTDSTLAPPNDAGPGSPTSEASRTEQEDHDLALALQLQEEEDDRHRRSQEERRRRENRLSDGPGSPPGQPRLQGRRTARPLEQPPVIPPRRNNVQTHRPNNEAAPPPTYEEAAVNPPYHPPQGHPANAHAPARPQGGAYSNMGPGPGGRRPSGRPLGNPPLPARPGRVSGPGGQEERDKCVVM